MKKLFYLFTYILIFTSCDQRNSDQPTPEDFGYLSMNISVSITEEPASGRVEAVPTDDWKVTIFDASDDSEVMVFDPFASAPAEVQLPTGEYYLEAHSNNFQEAAFENPYYFGRSANFTIDKEELKTIDIDAELANSKVAINYSPNVTSTFNSYSGTVSVVSSGASLVYNETETREGYFVSEPLSVVVDLSYTKLDGTFITRQFTANIDAQPKTLYNVNVDATLEDGKIVININVDETFEEIIIELGDASSDPNATWVAGDDWVDNRDGEVYGTVQIGDQVWMSENLRYLPEVHNEIDWEANGLNQVPAYGVYEYFGNEVNVAKEVPNFESFGTIYNWYAAVEGAAASSEIPSGVQGACPAGWYLPSQSEWSILFSQSGDEPGLFLVDETVGFNAVHAGIRTLQGQFGFATGPRWWSSSERFELMGEQSGIVGADIIQAFTGKTFGFSIRCIKYSDTDSNTDSDGDGIPDSAEIPGCENNPRC